MISFGGNMRLGFLRSFIGDGEEHTVVDNLEWKRWLVGEFSRDLYSVLQNESALVRSLMSLKLQLFTFLRI